MTATTKAYKLADLAALAPVIEEARVMWLARTTKHIAERGDEGTCVLGAGIAVHHLPPRCRKPLTRIVISADEFPAQGASTWESSVREVLAFLASKGVEDAWYSPGRMD